MNEENKKDEPTSFDVPVYATVWKSELDSYISGERDYLKDWAVSLRVGTVPDEYNENYAYMAVGKVTVQIPDEGQRIRAELLAVSLEMEAEKTRSMEKMKKLLERHSELTAIPHLDASAIVDEFLEDSPQVN
jgi:hypothetical protein